MEALEQLSTEREGRKVEGEASRLNSNCHCIISRHAQLSQTNDRKSWEQLPCLQVSLESIKKVLASPLILSQPKVKPSRSLHCPYRSRETVELQANPSKQLVSTHEERETIKTQQNHERELSLHDPPLYIDQLISENQDEIHKYEDQPHLTQSDTFLQLGVQLSQLAQKVLFAAFLGGRTRENYRVFCGYV